MKLLIAVALVACGKGDKPTKQNVTASVGGEALAIDRAFIKRISPEAYTVLAGAGKGSCAALLAGTNDGSGKAFSFTVHERVSPTGAKRHVIADLWSRDFEPGVAAGAEVKLAGTADKGTTTTIELPALAGTQLAVSGTLTAVGCGAVTPTGAGVPKAGHASQAKLTIANHELKVLGVTVQARKGVDATDLPNIVISTSPKDCSGVTLPAQVILERTDGVWSLHGTWLDGKLAASESNLAFTANNVGKSADGPTLILQLSGKGVFGGYTVELTGTAEAIECL